MEQNISAARVQLHTHVKPEVRDQLAAVARQNDRSLAAEIRIAVGEHIRLERQPVAQGAE